MPKVEVEIGEDGKVGTLPEPLQKLFDERFSEAFGKGKAKGAEAVADLERKIADLQKGGLDPADREKLKLLEREKLQLEEQIAIRDKKFEEAKEKREAIHKAELADRDAKLQSAQADLQERTRRIQELGRKDIRVAAIAAGARAEALDQIEALLGPRIGLDDALQPIVIDSAGTPALDKDGKAVTVEGLVQSFLTEHAYFKTAPSGRGAGGGGGRSLSGKPSGDAEKDAAFAAVAEKPTTTNLARAFRRLGTRQAS